MESISLSTTNTEMQYDGFLIIGYLKSANLQGYAIIINDITFTVVDSGNAQVGATTTIPFVKGDKIRLNVNFTPNQCKVRYYKLRDYTNR